MDLGPPGSKPESYWSPRLGEVCHLRPSDLPDMTLEQIHSSYIYAHPTED